MKWVIHPKVYSDIHAIMEYSERVTSEELADSGDNDERQQVRHPFCCGPVHKTACLGAGKAAEHSGRPQACSIVSRFAP